MDDFNSGREKFADLTVGDETQMGEMEGQRLLNFSCFSLWLPLS
jgi:hypothetical protein